MERIEVRKLRQEVKAMKARKWSAEEKLAIVLEGYGGSVRWLRFVGSIRSARRCITVGGISFWKPGRRP